GSASGSGFYLSPERKANYERDLGDKVWFGQIAASYSYLAANTLRPGPLQNPQVRRALSLWIDKRASVQAVFGGSAVLHTTISPKSPFPSPDWESWPGFNRATKEADRAEAKRLLNEANLSGGFKLTLSCRKEALHQCEFFQGELAPLGIQLSLGVYEAANRVAIRRAAEYDLDLGSHRTSLPEATEEAFARRSVGPNAYPIHEDTKVSDLYARLAKASELPQRIELWREIERYFIRDQVYVIPVFGESAIMAYRSYVKGMLVPAEDPIRNSELATVWLDK
ncbi:MAG: ABC transporter substrate-binding protein, partial [Chloroflexota bacterium]